MEAKRSAFKFAPDNLDDGFGGGERNGMQRSSRVFNAN
jgi:hypothetical protein